MKATELIKENIKNRIYLIQGNDLYWVDKSIKFFSELVEKENRDFNLKVIDKATDESIVTATATISMFGGANVVIVKDKDYKTDQEKEIVERLSNETDTYLIFVNTTLTKDLKKKAEVIECDKQDVSVIKELIKTQLNIDYEAINLLISYLNQDMSKINMEIIKLQAYSNGEKITAGIVKMLVANQIENQIFDLTNAVAQQNKVKTEEILEGFYKKGLPFAMLLSVLINQYRRMLHCSLSNLEAEELAKILNIKEFAIKKAREVGQKYSKLRLKNLLLKLENAEYSFKSGKMSDETAFKNVITELML